MVMLGNNKRLDMIEYRLARIDHNYTRLEEVIKMLEYHLPHMDKMIEDILAYVQGKAPPPRIEDAFIKQFESQVQQGYNRLEKEYKSVVIHKPKKKKKRVNYPPEIIKAMSGRYQTRKEIADRIGSSELSVQTYLKFIRKDGIKIMKRGHNPTQYKLPRGTMNNG
jgi:biotin operon repressor